MSISKASRQAEKSTYKQRVGAVLVKGNRVLATGYNQLRGHRSLQSAHWDNALHAEMHCILQALKRVSIEDIAGSTMFVSRIKRDGSTGPALPCADCFSVLQKFRVRRIIFTNVEGISEIKL
jgi:deoxycytidylate deaminase